MFAAISTTGPAIGVHEPWEIGLIEHRLDGSRHTHQFFVPPATMANADPSVLRRHGYHERTAVFSNKLSLVADDADPLPKAPQTWTTSSKAAGDVARVTAGAHIIASGVWFVTGMLDRFLRCNHRAPSWSSFVDVDSLAAGYLLQWKQNHQSSIGDHPIASLPWSAELMGSWLGIHFDDAQAAVDRAAWVRRMFETIVGEKS